MSIRTQIYLTDDQRTRLDELRRREGKTLAELVREAVEQLLKSRRRDFRRALDATFGAAPHLSVPNRDEWSRRG